MRPAPLLLLLALTSCVASAWQDLEEHLTDAPPSTSSSSTPDPTTSDATPTDPVATVTGPPPETTLPPETTSSDTTTTSEPNAPPEIDSFLADPPHLSEAGVSLLRLTVSPDATTVHLRLNGQPLADLTPTDFPYPFEALSAKDNTITDHIFEVEVADAEGLTVSEITKLSIELPPSGAQKCLFIDATAKQSAMAALAYTADALVAVGTRDTGAGFRMAIWKFDPDYCEQPLPGWPKTIADWTADPALAALPSRAAAVAVDVHGNIALGANLIVGGKPQRYTALLTPSGTRLWERAGLVGEEVSSVVVTPEPSSIVIAAGWKFTNDNPASTDAMIWRHLPDKTVWATTLKAPFTPDEQPDNKNEQSERIRAALFDPASGALVIAGERELQVGIFQLFSRTFAARFAPLGGAIGDPWTSSGDAFPHDAANSIAICDDVFILGGWTREHTPQAQPQPLLRWLANDVSWTKRSAESMSVTRAFGAACDREGKVVSAGLRASGELDARVFAFEDPLGPRTWYETGNPGDDGAGGLACDMRGFCGWPGFRTIDGKQLAVVRVHHP